MPQIYFGVYILPLIPHPPLLSRAPLELGGVGAVTFPPWGNSDRSRQGPLGSQAAACPHGTMLPSAAGRAGSTDHLSSGVQTTAVTPPVLPPQAARAAQTERRSTGMRALTRSTSRRPPALRVAAAASTRTANSAQQPVNRSTAGLSRWPPRFAAPPHPSPSPALGGSRAREAAPGHVPSPAPLPAQPCPSSCVGTVIRRSEGRIGPVNSQPELASAFPSHTLPRAFGPPLLENLQWPPGGLSSDSRADCHSKRPDTTYTLTQTSSPVTTF